MNIDMSMLHKEAVIKTGQEENTREVVPGTVLEESTGWAEQYDVKISDVRRQRAWIENDADALAHNVYFLQSRLHPACRLMPAVKANAYGHGAAEIAGELQKFGITAFCVACLEEALELRRAGITEDILILGYTAPEEMPLLEQYHLIQAVVDEAYAEELNNSRCVTEVHLAVDTGMHRLGVRAENTEAICRILDMQYLRVRGIFTHLCADDVLMPPECAYTAHQAAEFEQLGQILQERGYEGLKMHQLASYGVLNYPELGGDYARVGIALYGVLSTGEDTAKWQQELWPVLSLKARVASVRDLHPGEYAGYGMAFQAGHEMKIAALTIGYGDGVPRELAQNGGYVLLAGKRAPIIGRICMDQMMVDVSGIPEVSQGDTAVLLGRMGSEQITAADWADRCGTISNEILSQMGERLERIVTGKSFPQSASSIL